MRGSANFAERREQWRAEAIARHRREAEPRAVRQPKPPAPVALHWLDRGEWCVRRGDVILAWFRHRAEAEQFARELGWTP